MSETYEFYAPFAHIPGRFEWARIHSTTHGSFDCFIMIHEGTDKPVTVYVSCERGEQFMADRYPESRAIRVGEHSLSIVPGGRGRTMEGRLEAEVGPVRFATMTFTAHLEALPEAVPYGGPGERVWGSRYACEGVDLQLTAGVSGEIILEEGAEELAATEAVLTLGSYGRITELS
jgi:hypothetical protein